MFFWQGIVLIFNRNGYRKEVSFEFFPKYRQFIPLFFLRCDKKAIRINEIAMKQTVFEAKTRIFPYNCNRSACAIRKTALRAYCGCRHCFTHLQALSS